MRDRCVIVDAQNIGLLGSEFLVWERVCVSPRGQLVVRRPIFLVIQESVLPYFPGEMPALSLLFFLVLGGGVDVGLGKQQTCRRRLRLGLTSMGH